MLTQDRNTHSRAGDILNVPVAANVKIFAGALVCANATGYATPGAEATTLTYLGRAEEAVDNTGGADAAKTLNIRRKQAFKWRNSAGDPVTQASLGKSCYIEDDETVSATDNTGARSAAGIVLEVSADSVWVE